MEQLVGFAAMASFNLADLFELVADAVPDREAMVTAERRITYAQLDERANRLAHALAGAGVGEGQHVGLQLLNGTEYIEGMLAAFKIRAVPINVNYRYVEGELLHLYRDADLVALVLHGAFASRVAAIRSQVSKLTSYLVVDDGTEVDAGMIDYEGALAAAGSARDFRARSADDLYCVYTGGTTGMPKGVMWRQEDIFFAAMGGGDVLQQGDFIKTPEEIVSRIPAEGLVSVPSAPFMHAAAHWGAFSQLFGGGKIVVPPPTRFDPQAIWELVGREKANMLVIVGDAMARPLADELAASPGRYDTSSLLVIGSGGAILSAATKEQLTKLLPSAFIVDGFGASETGQLGAKASMAGGGPEGGPRFAVNEQTTVLGDDLKPVEPGSGQIGRLARRGYIPLGYYNDPDKTAATFAVADGVRWVLPGDMATIEADGTVALLGRGSVSINTGGEKVYPEEVEAALKAHPAVFDAVVVGVPDDRWGERVVAVVQTRPGTTPELTELQEFLRDQLAGFKIPRELRLVDEIVRSPSGKADYRWAKELALS
jgi:acyl-CoA synthetase (AMP-forming)/AMP-acid ligase II